MEENVCPPSCEMKMKATEEHYRTGENVESIIKKYKELNGFCHLCSRNEMAINPIWDMSREHFDEEE